MFSLFFSNDNQKNKNHDCQCLAWAPDNPTQKKPTKKMMWWVGIKRAVYLFSFSINRYVFSAWIWKGHVDDDDDIGRESLLFFALYGGCWGRKFLAFASTAADCLLACVYACQSVGKGREGMLGCIALLRGGNSTPWTRTFSSWSVMIMRTR